MKTISSITINGSMVPVPKMEKWESDSPETVLGSMQIGSVNCLETEDADGNRRNYSEMVYMGYSNQRFYRYHKFAKLESDGEIMTLQITETPMKD